MRPSPFLLQSFAALTLLTVSGLASAVDIGLTNRGDGSLTGPMSSARLLKAGEFRLGVQVQHNDKVSPMGENPYDAQYLLIDTSYSRAYVGWSFADGWELNLHGQATSEDSPAHLRDDFLELTDQEIAERKKDLKAAGFGEAGASLKLRFYQSKKWRLAGKLFASQGSNGKYAFTRTDGATYGASGLLGFGTARVAELDAELGMLTRSPSFHGAHQLGNEVFGSVAATKWFDRRWGTGLAVHGRSLSFKDVDPTDAKPTRTVGEAKVNTQSNLHLRLAYQGEATDVEVWAGAPLGDAGIGQGQRQLGFQLSYTLGSKEKQVAPAVAAPSVKPSAAKKVKTKPNPEDVVVKPADFYDEKADRKAHPEMYNTTIPAATGAGDDDFKRIQRENKVQKKGIIDEAKIESELGGLEAKAQAEQDRLAAEEEANKAQRQADIEASRKQEAKYRADAERKADEFDRKYGVESAYVFLKGLDE